MRTIRFLKILILLPLFILTILPPLGLGSPFVVPGVSDGINLGRYFHIYLDETNDLQIQQIIDDQNIPFKPLEEDHANFGITGGTSWARFQLYNPFPQLQEVFIENQYTMTDRVTLYQMVGDEITVEELGDQDFSSPRGIPFRQGIFPVKLQSGNNLFYVSVKTLGPNKIPLALWTAQELQRKMILETTIISIAIGIMIAMILYNLFLYISLRSLSYLFYVAFCVSFLMMQCSLAGIWSYLTFIGGDTRVWLMNWGFLFSACSSQLFSILFALSFFKVYKKYPKLVKGVSIYLAFLIMQIILILFENNYLLSSMLANSTAGLTCIFLLVLGFRYCLLGYRPAIYYTIAWMFVLIASILLSLTNMNLVPGSNLLNFGTLIGACIETTLLSLALADRVRLNETQRAEERESYIQELYKKESANHHSYSQMSKMVYSHQVQQMRSGMRLEETMPVGQKYACVICFDIIKSSELPEDRANQFFSAVFKECNSVIERNYNDTTLEADGFRINEMGDGFLCSVGFPFTLPRNISIEDKSILLANEFVDIFHKHAKNFFPREDLKCSLGIASGLLSTNFNQIGTLSYHVSGQPIILATRYESSRKLLYPAGPPSSIILVQDQVMAKVGPQLQSQFNTKDLSQGGVKIRDNEDSQVLFYALKDNLAANR